MFSIVTRNRKAAEVAVHFVHLSMNVIKEFQVQDPNVIGSNLKLVFDYRWQEIQISRENWDLSKDQVSFNSQRQPVCYYET